MAKAVKLDSVNEGVTADIAAVIQDDDDVAIAGSSLFTLALTLYDKLSGSKINHRDHHDILGVLGVRLNGGKVDEQGNLDLRLDPADTVIVDESQVSETHVALIEWSWFDTEGATRYGKQELWMPVLNLKYVGAD